MPTIPLYTSPTDPDAWHQVRAPGGYEWWYFDTDDLENDRHFVAVLFDGFPFDRGYLRRYMRYRRHPTRFAPPVGAEHRAVYMALHERGRIRAQFLTRFGSDQFHVSADRREIKIGLNRISHPGDKVQLEVSEGTIRASLTFYARFGSIEQRIAPQHQWIAVAPLCIVEGTIALGAESIPFRGRGYHDHCFGTALPQLTMPSWLKGRVLLDDRAILFNLAGTAHVVTADAGTVRASAAPNVRVEGAAPPHRITFPDNGLTLTNPCPIGASSFDRRLRYDARVGDERAPAVCQIMNLKRNWLQTVLGS